MPVNRTFWDVTPLQWPPGGSVCLSFCFQSQRHLPVALELGLGVGTFWDTELAPELLFNVFVFYY